MDFSSKGVKKRHMGDEILCNMRARLSRNGTCSAWEERWSKRRRDPATARGRETNVAKMSTTGRETGCDQSASLPEDATQRWQWRVIGCGDEQRPGQSWKKRLRVDLCARLHEQISCRGRSRHIEIRPQAVAKALRSSHGHSAVEASLF